MNRIDVRTGDFDASAVLVLDERPRLERVELETEAFPLAAIATSRYLTSLVRIVQIRNRFQ